MGYWGLRSQIMIVALGTLSTLASGCNGGGSGGGAGSTPGSSAQAQNFSLPAATAGGVNPADPAHNPVANADSSGSGFSIPSSDEHSQAEPPVAEVPSPSSSAPELSPQAPEALADKSASTPSEPEPAEPPTGGEGPAVVPQQEVASTLDATSEAPGDIPGQPIDSVTDPSGNLYALVMTEMGEGPSSGSDDFYSWLIKKSSDGGHTWSVVDDSKTLSQISSARSIALDSSGNLYVLGKTMKASRAIQWFLRKSADGGKSWKTSNIFKNLRPGSEPHSMAIDSSGSIYVAGAIQTKHSIPKWIVRKSNSQGKQWRTVDQFHVKAKKDNKKDSKKNKGKENSSPAPSEAFALAIDSSGQVYVAGEASLRWVVRRSSDQGKTWNNIDVPLLSRWISASAKGIQIDSSGNILVSGDAFVQPDAYSEHPVRHSVVRKSIDGGHSWVLLSESLKDSPSVASR